MPDLIFDVVVAFPCQIQCLCAQTMLKCAILRQVIIKCLLVTADTCTEWPFVIHVMHAVRKQLNKDATGRSHAWTCTLQYASVLIETVEQECLLRLAAATVSRTGWSGYNS